MKKTGLLIVAAVFVVGLGTAYANDFNGVTDFSGKSYDAGQIEISGQAAPANVYESSAPGSKRVIEDFNTTGRSYDDGAIGSQAPAKPVLRRNWAGKRSSVQAFDTGEIVR